MEMKWPVLMFCKSDGTMCAMDSEQPWNRKGMKIEKGDIVFIDSAGNKFNCNRIKKEGLAWRAWPDIIFLNPSYRVSYDLEFTEKIKLSDFKDIVMNEVSSLKFFSDNQDSLNASIRQSQRYEEIISLFY